MGTSAPEPKPLILLAEDDEGIRTLMRRILEQSGYDVVTAIDGPDAVNIAHGRGAAIRLLVSDMRMPGIPGDELARRLQSHIPGLKVILMSGSRRILASRQDGWTLLAKPFDPRSLLAAVSQALATK